MLAPSLILMLIAIIFQPVFHVWHGMLLLPLAGVIVGSAFGLWRLVLAWIGIFLILALLQPFPWIDFIIVLLAAGITSQIITRFVDQSHVLVTAIVMGLIFLVLVWLQTVIALHRVFDMSILGTFVLSYPFILGMVWWLTQHTRRSL